VTILSFFLVLWTRILGTRYSYTFSGELPKDKPVIIVANHQSLYDIPYIIWKLRKLHPKFIAKKELGKGIPSISYNLKHGGSVLIDRKKSDQSVKAIISMTEYINKYNRSVVIFPEGTRSKNGLPRPFKRGGLKTLLLNSPEAMILPVTINNSWKMHRWGAFPNGIGIHLKYHVHDPIKNEGSPEFLIDLVEKKIKSKILESS
jgi:1-acyl-sn-glycerol-3-phosphate acyltransferase